MVNKNVSQLVKSGCGVAVALSLMTTACGSQPDVEAATSAEAEVDSHPGVAANSAGNESPDGLEEEVSGEGESAGLGDQPLAAVVASAAEQSRELGFSFEQEFVVDINLPDDVRTLSSSVPIATGHLVGNDFVMSANLGEFSVNSYQTAGENAGVSATEEQLVWEREVLSQIELGLWVVGDQVVMDKSDFYTAFNIGGFDIPEEPDLIDLSRLTNLTEFEINAISGREFTALVSNPSALLTVVESLSGVALDETNISEFGTVYTGSIPYVEYATIVGVVPGNLVDGVMSLDLNSRSINEAANEFAGEIQVDVAVVTNEDSLLQRVSVEFDLGPIFQLAYEQRATEDVSSTFIVRYTQMFSGYGDDFEFDVPANGRDLTERFAR